MKKVFLITGKITMFMCCVIITISVVFIEGEMKNIDYYINSAVASAADSLNKNMYAMVEKQDSLVNDVEYTWG